jgi:hypothetical protein
VHLSEMAFDPGSVRKALAIADVPVGIRHPWLTADHYYVVHRLMYPEQVRWLALAVERKMPALLLKRSIEHGRPLTQEELANLTGAGSGIPNYHGILTDWERWKKRVGGDDVILHWSRPVLEQWLEDMDPIVDLVDRARVRLSQDELM